MATQAIRSPQDLFVHELATTYDAEQRILQMLNQTAGMEQNAQVKQALEHHRQETQQQIQNLEQAFQALGIPPQRVPCYAVEGLHQDHQQFAQQSVPANLMTLYHLGAAAKTEHYEVATYQGLIERAKRMGHPQVAQLLQENLRHEQEMARKVEQMEQQLGQQMSQQTGP